jgi:hypothetical protein
MATIIEEKKLLLDRAIEAAFQDCHGFSPRDWQKETVAKLLNRLFEDDATKIIPSLLVRSTGGGKSAVRDALGLLLGGVVTTLGPLHGLTADQTQKLIPLSRREHTVGVQNLDSFRKPNIAS